MTVSCNHRPSCESFLKIDFRALVLVLDALALGASADENTITVTISFTSRCVNNNLVGTDWSNSYTAEYNGVTYDVDRYGGTDIQIQKGDTITVRAYICELDDGLSDTGSDSCRFTFSNGDLGAYCDATRTITVTEDGGSHAGNTATWEVSWHLEVTSTAELEAEEAAKQATIDSFIAIAPGNVVYAFSSREEYYHATEDCPLVDGYYCREYSIIAATNYGMLPCPVCVDADAAEAALAEAGTEETTTAETEPAESELVESEALESESTEAEESKSEGHGLLWQIGTGIALFFLILILVVPVGWGLVIAVMLVLNMTPISNWFRNRKEKKQLADPTYGMRKKELRKKYKEMLETQADQSQAQAIQSQSYAALSKQYKDLSTECSSLQHQIQTLHTMNRAFLKKNQQLQRDVDSVVLSLEDGEGYVVTTKNGDYYHRPDCSQLKGKKLRLVSVEDVQAEHMKPCKTYQPLQITIWDK